MPYKVPFVNAPEHYRRYKSEFEQVIIDTLSRGDLIMRRQLRDFEEHLAAFVGVQHAVGLGSGYHALHLSLVAAGIRPGPTTTLDHGSAKTFNEFKPGLIEDRRCSGNTLSIE